MAGAEGQSAGFPRALGAVLLPPVTRRPPLRVHLAALPLPEQCGLAPGRGTAVSAPTGRGAQAGRRLGVCMDSAVRAATESQGEDVGAGADLRGQEGGSQEEQRA